MSEAWKAWERAIANEAVGKPYQFNGRLMVPEQVYGFPWERRLRGGDNLDILDLDGTLPDGLIIGGKAVSRKTNLADRMSDAMLQSERGLENVRTRFPGRFDDVVPFQIIQRMGYTVGKAYAVTEYRHLLRLVVERRKWRANQ